MVGIIGKGLYMKAIRGWKKKPVEDQTWKNFKTYFADNYHELK